jgi:hypothetical protein
MLASRSQQRLPLQPAGSRLVIDKLPVVVVLRLLCWLDVWIREVGRFVGGMDTTLVSRQECLC